MPPQEYHPSQLLQVLKIGIKIPPKEPTSGKRVAKKNVKFPIDAIAENMIVDSCIDHSPVPAGDHCSTILNKSIPGLTDEFKLAVNTLISG